MAVDDVHKTYIQKSQIFLYPSLLIKRGIKHVPIGTYVAWKGMYVPEDKKLICLYKLDDSAEFKQLEKKSLIGNKLFHDFQNLDENKAAYIFDLSLYATDYELFTQGKYSQMSDEYKQLIENFYKNNVNDYRVIESFLRPHKYYWVYRTIFNVEIENFRIAGELCSKPDFDKEELIINVKSLDNIFKMI